MVSSLYYVVLETRKRQGCATNPAALEPMKVSHESVTIETDSPHSETKVKRPIENTVKKNLHTSLHMYSAVEKNRQIVQVHAIATAINTSIRYIDRGSFLCSFLFSAQDVASRHPQDAGHFPKVQIEILIR